MDIGEKLHQIHPLLSKETYLSIVDSCRIDMSSILTASLSMKLICDINKYSEDVGEEFIVGCSKYFEKNRILSNIEDTCKKSQNKKSYKVCFCNKKSREIIKKLEKIDGIIHPRVTTDVDFLLAEEVDEKVLKSYKGQMAQKMKISIISFVEFINYL